MRTFLAIWATIMTIAVAFLGWAVLNLAGRVGDMDADLTDLTIDAVNNQAETDGPLDWLKPPKTTITFDVPD